MGLFFLDTPQISVIFDIELYKGTMMETEKLSIPNITCGHCVMTIQRELGEIDGVSRVEGDPAAKEITVEWDAPATLAEIKTALKEINYPAVE